MGTRAYAEEVCAAIDPDGRIFGGRILSRDESGSESNRLSIIGEMHSTLCNRFDTQNFASTVPLRHFYGGHH